MYAVVQGGQVIEHPLTRLDLLERFSNTMFVGDDLPDGWVSVQPTSAPAVTYAQNAVSGTPVRQGGQWFQTWVVVDATAEQIATRVQILEGAIVARVQRRLDEFSRTRNYDGILSACTYATSTVARFASDGQYCVQARDATWSQAYAIMAEVQAGTRQMPSGYADIEADLPALTWPQ